MPTRDQGVAVAQPVRTIARVDGRRIHRFQVVRERREGANGANEGAVETWIVVGFDDGEVHLADVDFEWTRTVPEAAFRSGRFEPLVAGDVPVWGY